MRAKTILERFHNFSVDFCTRLIMTFRRPESLSFDVIENCMSLFLLPETSKCTLKSHNKNASRNLTFKTSSSLSFNPSHIGPPSNGTELRLEVNQSPAMFSSFNYTNNRSRDTGTQPENHFAMSQPRAHAVNRKKCFIHSNFYCFAFFFILSTSTRK